MAVESDADRAVFVNPDDFGTVATYRLAAGGSADIAVMRDLPFAMAFSDPGMATGSPSVTLRSADLPAGAAEEDEIDVEGVTYAVRVIEPDGTGMTRLRLEEIDP
ncbi:hypothetical protein C3941_23835 [Kaistia algarum]|uniref:head-tail joining protein n=1 Tax=Kaistia algarum TaxID=2083279 RepID=UPI000CE8E8A0|nr:hypothetical protein [Kaistia algarum]MCX5513424.1 hypothetical protein [Kaistia algarum]PPE77430.1 hypothetical protein C3941_23835 [Kaistia algarum]